MSKDSHTQDTQDDVFCDFHQQKMAECERLGVDGIACGVDSAKATLGDKVEEWAKSWKSFKKPDNCRLLYEAAAALKANDAEIERLRTERERILELVMDETPAIESCAKICELLTGDTPKAGL